MFKLLQSEKGSYVSWLLDGVRNERKQCKVSCALDRDHQHALVFCARSRDTLWNDPALLRNKTLELLLGLVIDEILLVVAETTGALFPDLAGCTPL
jgi:hypothetical protein